MPRTLMRLQSHKRRREETSSADEISQDNTNNNHVSTSTSTSTSSTTAAIDVAAAIAAAVDVDVEIESLDYVKDMETAYDSETRTAEDNVPILEYMKYLMSPSPPPPPVDVEKEDESKEAPPATVINCMEDDSELVVEGSECLWREDDDDDEEERGKINPVLVEMVGLENARAICVPRRLIQESGKVYANSWTYGKINNTDCGYIPSCALLLCLPETRLHDAGEDKLQKIVKETRCVELVQAALKRLGLEQRYPRLMAHEKTMVFTDKRVPCLKATIFVTRMFSAQQILNPETPPNLDRVEYYLKLMNRYIKVTSEEVMEWKKYFASVKRRKMQRMHRQAARMESQSSADSSSSPSSYSSFSSSTATEPDPDGPSKRAASRRIFGDDSSSSSSTNDLLNDEYGIDIFGREENFVAPLSKSFRSLANNEVVDSTYFNKYNFCDNECGNTDPTSIFKCSENKSKSVETQPIRAECEREITKTMEHDESESELII
jgi:hypothetical protein